MPHRNEVSWGAVRMFLHMHSAGFTPTEFTFVGLLSGCSDVGALAVRKQTHGLMVKLGFEVQVYVKSALMDHVVPMGIRAPADNSSYVDHVVGSGNSASVPVDIQQLIYYPFFGEQDKFVGSSFEGLPLEYQGT